MLTDCELIVGATLWLLAAVRTFQSLWLGTRQRASGWPRDSGQHGTFAVTIATGALAFVVTVDPPGVARSIDKWLGSPNLTHLVQHSAGLLALNAFLVLAYERTPALGGIRRQLRLTAIAVAVMAVAFRQAPIHRAPIDFTRWVDFTSAAAKQPWVVLYWLAYAGTAGWGLLRMITALHVYVASTPQGRTRVALRLITAGCWSGCVYFVVNSLVMLGVLTGSPVWVVRCGTTFTHSIILTIGVLFFAGVVWLNARVGSAIELLLAKVDLVRLAPLWSDMAQAAPVLPLTERHDRLGRRDVRLRLYRTVIEIRDGYLRIEPWYDPAQLPVVAAAASAAGDDPLVVATCWELARRAKLREGPTCYAGTGVGRGGGDTLREEIRELRRAARLRRHAHRLADAIESDRPVRRVRPRAAPLSASQKAS